MPAQPPEPAALAPRRVADAVTTVGAAMAALDAARRRLAGPAGTNTHGGDPGAHANRSTLVRHVVNYLVAAAAGSTAGADGAVLDVGAGSGGFSGLLAERTGRRLHLVERDGAHAALAAAAFPHLPVHADAADAPAGAVVTAMEVVEHLQPGEQPAFVAALAARVLPGGVLVLSTPDESGYPGGWSGYAPHTAPVDAAGLAAAVAEGTGGWPARVVRVGGPRFDLTAPGALLQGGANRAWNAVAPLGPLARRLEPLGMRLARTSGRVRPAPPVPPDGAWRVEDAAAGTWRSGTGLVAVAVRPG